MRRFLLSVLLLCCSTATHAGLPIKPSVKTVTLEKFTQISIPVIPDLGMRLVFPFVLDAKSEYVPFTLETTNAAFLVPEPKPGRNVLTVKLPAGAYAERMLGSVYITVGGYQVTVLLHATGDVRQYVSDVNFVLGDKERQDLIHMAVERETESIRKEYEAKAELLDRDAHNIALQQLGALLLREPERENIYEEGGIDFGTGALSVSVPRSLVLGPFRAYELSLGYETSSNTPLRLTDAKLFGRDAEGKIVSITATADLPSSIKPGETGHGILVTDALDLGRFVGFEITVNSASGEATVKW